MTTEKDPYPAWSEAATKGDLIRAIVYFRSNVAALASVVLAMRMNDESEAQKRMMNYFDGSEELDRVMAEIAGKEP